MPELMSHLIIGLILAELLNVKKKSIVVLGALIPDLLAKVQLAYLHFKMPPVVSFTSFHTPAMGFLLGIAIAPLFRYDAVKTIIAFSIGAMSHFIADLTMKHFAIIGTRLFFPFSMRNFTLNLIWPNDSMYILFFALAAYIAIRILKIKLIKKHKI